MNSLICTLEKTIKRAERKMTVIPLRKTLRDCLLLRKMWVCMVKQQDINFISLILKCLPLKVRYKVDTFFENYNR